MGFEGGEERQVALAGESRGRRDEDVTHTAGSAQIVALGRRIQARRVLRSVTLDALAQLTEFSKGYLSRIENGKKSPPLATLSRIARALGTDINLLLAGETSGAEPRPFFSVVRAGARERVLRPESARGYAYERLTASASGLCMQPYVIRLPREFTAPGLSEHDGQEFMYVLCGRIEWEIGGETLLLEVGDAVYLDSRIPHRARALDGEGQALVVVTPRPPAGRAAETRSP